MGFWVRVIQCFMCVVIVYDHLMILQMILFKTIITGDNIDGLLHLLVNIVVDTSDLDIDVSKCSL